MAQRDDIECWLTDMDGVLVHENDAIPGASERLAGWESAGIPYFVLTNNSIFTARDLSARLRASGLRVPEDRIWTSALVTADFLKQSSEEHTSELQSPSNLVCRLLLTKTKRSTI